MGAGLVFWHGLKQEAAVLRKKPTEAVVTEPVQSFASRDLGEGIRDNGPYRSLSRTHRIAQGHLAGK